GARSGPETQGVVRTLIRVSAESIAGLHPAVAFTLRDAGPARAGSAAGLRWRPTGSMLVRVAMLAIALELTWPVLAWSQMPLARRAAGAAEMRLALPAPPAVEVPPAPRAVEVPPAPPAVEVPPAPPAVEASPAPPAVEASPAPPAVEASPAPPA